MAMKPFFITGANAKLKIDNKLIGFAQDVSYTIEVRHAAPKVCGMYESYTLEPLSYNVTGSFTILRYVKGIKEKNGMNVPEGVSNEGNGLGSYGEGALSAFMGNSGHPDENLDPSTFNIGTFFDIDIYQLIPEGMSNEIGNQKTGAAYISKGVKAVTDFWRGAGSDRNMLVAKMKDCRITRADFRMTKRSAATETFAFQALYADEDSFNAIFSGRGQQYTV